MSGRSDDLASWLETCEDCGHTYEVGYWQEHLEKWHPEDLEQETKGSRG